jgi:hypothetical protein
MKNRFKVGLISVKQGDNFPHSGLVYLGTYLKKYLGKDIDLKIIDQNFDNAEYAVRTGNFDLIGMSAMTIYYGRVLRLARAIKKDINIPIIIGGGTYFNITRFV